MAFAGYIIFKTMFSCNVIKILSLCLILFLFFSPVYGQVNEIEPNGIPLNAQVINLPAFINGNAGNNTDDSDLKITTSVSDKEIPVNDLFKFTLTKKTNIEILLKILNQSADVDLIVIDNDLKNVVASSVRVFSESEFVFKELEAGSYFIGIVSQGGITDYTLEIKETQINDLKPHIQELEPNSLSPQEVTLPTVVEGVLDTNDFTGSSVLFKNNYRDVKDLYVFNLEVQKNLIISPENTDPQSSLGIVLYDSFKKIVEISQDEISHGLDPGLYYVGVFSVTGGSRYSLSIEVNASDLSPDKVFIFDEISPLIALTGQDTLILLPILKQNEAQVNVNASKFLTKSKCKVGEFAPSFKKSLKVLPKQFFLTPKRTSQAVRLIVSEHHAHKLRTDSSIETINLSIFCENGAKASKEIILKPSSLL